MVEVIHEHDSTNNSNSFGMMFGILIAVALVLFLFYFFGRGLLQGTQSQVPQVNIPDHVNVDINQQKPAGK
jgi:flagellar biogenesis protein FliO